MSNSDWITTAHVLCDRLGIERKADSLHIINGINDLREALKAKEEECERLKKADYFFDADEWEFTTDDSSDVLDNGIAYSKNNIVRLGRFKRLSDKYVCEIYNEEQDEYVRHYFNTLEEAKQALEKAK